MKLVTKWFGVFLVDEDEIVKYELFPKNSDEIAERLKKINDGEILDEEEKLTKGMEIEKGERDIDYSDYGFTLDLLHSASIQFGKMLFREIPEDRYVIQAVNAIDEINKAINIMTERFIEWYLYYFPEEKEKNFGKIIAEYDGENKTNPETETHNISSTDKEMLKDVAISILTLQKTKNKLEKYVEKEMEKIAPNLSFFAGPRIGAKLIALSGGLGRLSVMPSSKIQLLGAEKALFRHLSHEGKSPKYGVIFQHPVIHNAKHNRGRIARVFANNAAIAVRADYYSKHFIGNELKKRFMKQISKG